MQIFGNIFRPENLDVAAFDVLIAMYTDPATGAKRPRDSPRESPPSESRCRYLSVSSLPGNCSHSELVREPPLNWHHIF